MQKELKKILFLFSFDNKLEIMVLGSAAPEAEEALETVYSNVVIQIPQESSGYNAVWAAELKGDSPWRAYDSTGLSYIDRNGYSIRIEPAHSLSE